MNKYLLLIGFLTILCSVSTTYGQKKAVKAGKPAALEIKNEADSLSYAFGASIVEGLPQYLIQTGILADTAAISADYRSKIQSEPDAMKQNALKNEMQSKIDSAIVKNNADIDVFLQGFNQVFFTPKSKDVFNTGMAIALQMKGATDNFSKQVLEGQDINKNLFASAFTAALKKEGNLLIANPQELIQEKAAQAQQKAQQVEQEKLKVQYADQIKKGEEFMAANKANPGVVVLPSGLQYKIVTEGNGPIPKANDKVKVHYHGTLIDGTVFDSSVDRGEPAEFRVGQLIQGWNQALMMMPVGSKWILYVPYNLAYGERDMGQIKPFSDLIFEVELISIEETE